MSTRTDFNIKASEAFFNLPDVTSINNQRFIVTKSQWFGQVFISKSAELQKVFFLCDNTEGLEIVIHKAIVSTSGGKTIYTPGQIVTSVLHEVDSPSPFQKLPGQTEDIATWHYPNWLATPQTADNNEDPYIIVFKTDTDETPSLYFTLEYRQTVFPQIIGWDGESWANSNITTKTVASTQIGAIISGYIGNEVNEETVLDSGTNIVGGRGTARRAFPIFMFVENLSSQNDKISVNFSLIPPSSISDGTTEETAQAMMKWYFFAPGSLPSDKNFNLKNARENSELDALTSFAIYMQPDRLSPFADNYLPESELDLQANALGVVPIYEGGNTNSNFIQDSTDRFTKNFWTNFSNGYDLVVDGGTGDRDADASTNPDYIDLTLENPNGEIDVLRRIELTDDILDGALTEKELVRGFSKMAFFNNKYIFFSQKTTENLNLTDPSSIPETPGKLLAYITDSDFSNFEKKTIVFSDSTPSTLGLNTGGVFVTYIFAINDTACVKINGIDTLLVLTKTFISTSGTLGDEALSWFDIGYYQGDFSEDEIAIQLINHESIGIGTSGLELDVVLGTFSNLAGGGSSLLVDEDTNTMFITPNNGDAIYFTANSDYNSQSLLAGCGIWKIGINDVLSSIYEAERIKPNNQTKNDFVLLIAPFASLPAQTGIIDQNDVRITSVIYDGSTTYLGVRGETAWVEFVGNALVQQQFAKVYKTDDFQTFEQLIGSDIINFDDSGSDAILTGELPSYLDPYITREELFNSFSVDNSTELPFIDISGSFTPGDTLTGWAGSAELVEIVFAEEDSTQGTFIIKDLVGELTGGVTITGSGGGTALYSYPFGLSSRIINNDVKFMHKVGNILHVWVSPHFYDAKNTPMHLAVNVQTKEVKVLREFPIEDDDDSGYNFTPKISDLDKFPRSKALRWIEGGSVNGNHIYLYGADRFTSNSEGPHGDIFFASPAIDTVPVPHKYPSEYSARWLMYDDRTINKAFENASESQEVILFAANLSEVRTVAISDKIYETIESLNSDSNTSRLEIQNNIAYTMTVSEDSVSAFDIRDPFNISEIDTLDFADDLSNLGSDEISLFVIEELGLRIIDLLDIESGSITLESGAFLSIDDPTNDIHVGFINGAISSGAELYVLGNVTVGMDVFSAFFVYDISDRSSPAFITKVISSFEGGSLSSLAFSKNKDFIYISRTRSESHLASIEIYNITDPSIPTFVTNLPEFGTKEDIDPKDTMLRKDDNLFVTSKGSLRIYDVSDVDSPSLISQLTKEELSTSYFVIGDIDGNRLYCNGIDSFSNSVFSFDISNVSDPKIAARFSSSPPPQSLLATGKRKRKRSGFENITLLNGDSKGVYHGKTIVPFSHDESSSLFSKYPSLSPDLDSLSTNPRVGVYCSLVNYGAEKTEGIINNSNVFSGNITINGINYLTTSNDDKGIQLFKTYGIKELPTNWGKSLKLEDGSDATLEDYEFADLDLASFERAIAGEETFKNSARRVINLESNNVLVLSEMKSNDSKDSGEFIDITDEFPKRTLFVLNSSLMRPQHLSMFYRFKLDGSDPTDLLNLSDPDTSETLLTVRGAETLEKLFTDLDLNIELPLAQDVTEDKSNRVMTRNVFPTDLQSNFFRIETPSLYDNLELQVKGLRFFDITTGFPESVTAIKKVAINGIVDSETTDPENAIDNGVVLSPGGEIIIDFIKPIFINEVSFTADYSSNDTVGIERSEFEFTSIKNFEKRTIADNIVGPNDWEQLGQNIMYVGKENSATIKKENIASYVQAIRIRTITGVSFRLKDLVVKGFATDSNNQITSSGKVRLPESILVDDIEGLLGLNIPGNEAAAFATFDSNGSYVEFDLGENIPLTRIKMNIAGEEETNTRTIQVETWDGVTMDGSEISLENIFTGPVPNYEFSIVRWQPRPKDRSRNVEIEFLDSAATYTPDPLLVDSNIGNLLLDFNNLSNNSGFLDMSGLSGWSFKPALFKDRSITVSSSEGRFETGTDEDYIDADADGLIVLNAQMDEDGPFAEDVDPNALGMLENSLNIDFSVKQVRRIRVTLRNHRNGDNSIKINGLRTFSPIVDKTGNAQNPVSTATWNIRLGLIVSTEG